MDSTALQWVINCTQRNRGLGDLSSLLKCAMPKTTPVLGTCIVPLKLVIFVVLPEAHLLDSWLLLFTFRAMQACAQWLVD